MSKEELLNKLKKLSILARIDFMWKQFPEGKKAKQTLYNLFLDYPELFDYVNKSLSGRLLCSKTGEEIDSIDDCIMFHIVIDRDGDIDHEKVFFPETNKHTIVPIKQKNTPEESINMYQEFLKWDCIKKLNEKEAK